MSGKAEEKSPLVFGCSSSSEQCRCRCPEGPCEHKWDGPWVETDAHGGESVTCSRCGMTSMGHSMWIGP